MVWMELNLNTVCYLAASRVPQQHTEALPSELGDADIQKLERELQQDRHNVQEKVKQLELLKKQGTASCVRKSRQQLRQLKGNIKKKHGFLVLMNSKSIWQSLPL